MKTRISQIAALTFFSLFILVGNIYASEKGKIILPLENIEESLEVENWMVNDNFWKMDKTITLTNLQEETLELENWMTNDNVWKVKNNNLVETEIEVELELEAWMTDENIWNK